MITLRYSYANFVTEENTLLYRLIILYFYEYCGISVKIISLDNTTHCSEKLLMLSTVMRTVNELIETVTAK